MPLPLYVKIFIFKCFTLREEQANTYTKTYTRSGGLVLNAKNSHKREQV